MTKVKQDFFKDERGGDGRPLYSHRYEDDYMSRHLTLDDDRLDVSYMDCDGDHCNITLEIKTIAELMRRAGYLVAWDPNGVYRHKAGLDDSHPAQGGGR